MVQALAIVEPTLRQVIESKANGGGQVLKCKVHRFLEAGMALREIHIALLPIRPIELDVCINRIRYVTSVAERTVVNGSVYKISIVQIRLVRHGRILDF